MFYFKPFNIIRHTSIILFCIYLVLHNMAPAGSMCLIRTKKRKAHAYYGLNKILFIWIAGYGSLCFQTIPLSKIYYSKCKDTETVIRHLTGAGNHPMS